MDTRSHVRGAQTVSNSFFHFVFRFIISFFIIIIVSSLASVSVEKIKLLTDRLCDFVLFCRRAILRLNAHHFDSFSCIPFFFLLLLLLLFQKEHFSGGFSLSQR